MKILLVHDYGVLAGGAEVQILGLRERLRERGHDARLFASSARPDELAPLAADYSCFGTTRGARTLLQTANPWAYLELRRVLGAFRPDVVHVKMFLTQLSPLILPLLARVPSLYHAVWYRAVCPLGTKLLPDGSRCRVPAGAACLRNGCLPVHDWGLLMMQMGLLRRWRRAFRGIVANSGAVRARLEEAGIGPAEVIWNGVPVGPMRPPLAGPPTVAFAGRLVPEKGVDVLLEAFALLAAEIPDARLLVAGSGPERERIAARASASPHSSRVSLLGHLSRAEVEAAFRTAWVQAVPSRWDEPFGLVAAEAMMRGTAVVASASGGLAEIVVPERTGLLVPPGDARALAAALRRLLLDRDLAERMGRAARERALAEFDEAVSADRFVRFYEKLTRGAGERA
jgi:glycosyltransferase involved in cell wall biosynthesis